MILFNVMFTVSDNIPAGKLVILLKMSGVNISSTAGSPMDAALVSYTKELLLLKNT